MVLNESDIARVSTRISHEILESNRGTSGLILLGIPTRGVVLARRLATVIAAIEPDVDADRIAGSLDTTPYRDDLARTPLRATRPTSIPAPLDGATVVLVDDVLYSGRTIRAALDALSDLGRPRIVRLAVLVDRGHRELPIRADFVGKNLPSAADERVFVRLAEIDGEDAVTIDGGDGTTGGAPGPTRKDRS